MNVSIYIENYKLDTNEDTIVALTMCYSYVEDPTTIAGDYSKSITVPGTVNNNRIFGQFWSIDRRFLENDDSNTGVYFNASKRTPAKIYLGNDIFKSGYVQLNAVNKTQGKITYEITFYSELCNLLHTILDSSLSALKFPGSLAHVINTNSIYDNVNENGPKIAGTSSNLNDYLHYGLSLDGVFDNFNSSKWLTYDSGQSKWVVADIDDYGTSYDTAMILQSPSNRVRPYVKVSSLLNQIRDDYNDSNDTLLEYSDPYFFNSTNPYVGNTVMSCKVYSTENTSTSISNIYFDDFEVPTAGVANAIVIKAKGSDLVDENGYIDLSSMTVIPRIEIECMLAFDGSLNTTQYNNAIKNAVYTEGRQFTSTGSILPRIVLQRMDSSGNVAETKEMAIEPIYTGFGDRIFCNQIKDDHNTVISPLVFESRTGTPTFEVAFKNCVFNRVSTVMDCTTTPCTYKEKPIYDKRYTNLNTQPFDTEIADMYTDYDDGIGVTDFFPFKFYLGNITPGLWRVRVHVSPNNLVFHVRDCGEYSFGDSSVDLNVSALRMRVRFNTKVGNNSLTYSNRMLYRNTQPLQVYLANNLENTTVTNTTGLPLSMTSSTGTNTDSMVSFADMVDTDTTQGDFLVNYTKIFGLVYDSDNVNTDHKIKIKTRDYYHQDYKILDWTDKIDYSQTFKHDPLSFSTRYLSLNYNPSESYYAKKYANTFDTSYGVQLVDTGYEFNTDTSTMIENQMFTQCIMVKNESRFKGICPAFFDKSDNSRSPIDGQYSLLFWNTDKSDCYKQNLFIYDDTQIMHDASVGGEETMCFVDTSALAGGGVQLNGRNIGIPAPNSLRDKFSTDLGYPRANYAGWNISTYPSSGTIFNQFWNSYIKDLYNANTQIITAYVHLSPLEIMNFSFKNFVKIKDTLWHPNKIEDYNPLSTKPVSVELVKVNDINAYTNSQVKFYEYFRAEFNVYTNDSTIPANKILNPVAGGVVTGASTNQYYGNFRYGSKWSQGFTTVAPYTKVGSVEAFYYTNDGEKIDCSSWFNIYTYTFTCQEIPTSDVTVNIRMDENVVYYNVGLELDNAQVTWIQPTVAVTRIKANESLEITFAKQDDLSSEYKLAYATVTMAGVDISSSVVDSSNQSITIDKVTGDVVINIAYAEFNDILLPYAVISGNIGLDFGANDITEFSMFRNSDSSVCIGNDYTSSGNTGYYFKSVNIFNTSSNVSSKDDYSIRYKERNGPSTSVTDKSLNISVDNTNDNRIIRLVNSPSTNIQTNYYKELYGNKMIESPSSGVRNTTDMGLLMPQKLFRSGNITFRYIESQYNVTPTKRFIPMMKHYENEGYKPIIYDVYSNSIVLDKSITADSTMTNDIALQWIGNNKDNPGSFNIGSGSDTVGISIYFFTEELNNDEYIMSCDSEHVEYDYNKKTISGTCQNFIKMDSTYEVRCNYQMYLSDDLHGTVLMPVEMVNTGVKGMNIITIVPGSSYDALNVNGKSSSAVEKKVVNQTSTMYLFKNTTADSYSSKTRIHYVKTLVDSLGFNNRYYIPVLHFTGDKTQYISNEGIKVPLGYTPCLYETFNKQYVYLSTGNPSFGFKHNS